MPIHTFFPVFKNIFMLQFLESQIYHFSFSSEYMFRKGCPSVRFNLILFFTFFSIFYNEIFIHSCIYFGIWYEVFLGSFASSNFKINNISILLRDYLVISYPSSNVELRLFLVLNFVCLLYLPSLELIAYYPNYCGLRL